MNGGFQNNELYLRVVFVNNCISMIGPWLVTQHVPIYPFLLLLIMPTHSKITFLWYTLNFASTGFTPHGQNNVNSSYRISQRTRTCNDSSATLSMASNSNNIVSQQQAQSSTWWRGSESVGGMFGDELSGLGLTLDKSSDGPYISRKYEKNKM